MIYKENKELIIEMENDSTITVMGGYNQSMHSIDAPIWTPYGLSFQDLEEIEEELQIE